MLIFYRNYKMLNTLRELLKSDIVEVNFTKVDGTERIMKCTLDPGYIATHTEIVENTKNDRVPNEEVLVVFDTEKNAWRSMRVESIINYR